MDNPPRYIQTHSLLEFSRLVHTLEITHALFLHYHGVKILHIQDLLEKKPTYFAPIKDDGNYLCYDSDGKDYTNSTSSKTYSIIKSPLFTKPGINLIIYPIDLEYMSIAKLSCGFTYVLFPKNTKWFIVIFVNFYENGQSFCCMINNYPQKLFIKFTCDELVNSLSVITLIIKLKLIDYEHI